MSPPVVQQRHPSALGRRTAVKYSVVIVRNGQEKKTSVYPTALPAASKYVGSVHGDVRHDINSIPSIGYPLRGVPAARVRHPVQIPTRYATNTQQKEKNVYYKGRVHGSSGGYLIMRKAYPALSALIQSKLPHPPLIVQCHSARGMITIRCGRCCKVYWDGSCGVCAPLLWLKAIAIIREQERTYQ